MPRHDQAIHLYDHAGYAVYILPNGIFMVPQLDNSGQFTTADAANKEIDRAAKAINKVVKPNMNLRVIDSKGRPNAIKGLNARTCHYLMDNPLGTTYASLYPDNNLTGELVRERSRLARELHRMDDILSRVKMPSSGWDNEDGGEHDEGRLNNAYRRVEKDYAEIVGRIVGKTMADAISAYGPPKPERE